MKGSLGYKRGRLKDIRKRVDYINSLGKITAEPWLIGERWTIHVKHKQYEIQTNRAKQS